MLIIRYNIEIITLPTIICTILVLTVIFRNRNDKKTNYFDDKCKNQNNDTSMAMPIIIESKAIFYNSDNFH